MARARTAGAAEGDVGSRPSVRSRAGSLDGLGASIKRHSTAEQVAAALRSAILEGRLLPGGALLDAGAANRSLRSRGLFTRRSACGPR